MYARLRGTGRPLASPQPPPSPTRSCSIPNKRFDHRSGCRTAPRSKFGLKWCPAITCTEIEFAWKPNQRHGRPEKTRIVGRMRARNPLRTDTRCSCHPAEALMILPSVRSMFSTKAPRLVWTLTRRLDLPRQRRVSATRKAATLKVATPTAAMRQRQRRRSQQCQPSSSLLLHKVAPPRVCVFRRNSTSFRCPLSSPTVGALPVPAVDGSHRWPVPHKDSARPRRR